MYARPVIPTDLYFGGETVEKVEHPGGWPCFPHPKTIPKRIGKPYVCHYFEKPKYISGKYSFAEGTPDYYRVKRICPCTTNPRQLYSGQFSFDPSKKCLVPPYPYAERVDTERQRAMMMLASEGYTCICPDCANILLMFDYMPGIKKTNFLKKLNDSGLIEGLQMIQEEKERRRHKYHDLGYQTCHCEECGPAHVRDELKAERALTCRCVTCTTVLQNKYDEKMEALKKKYSALTDIERAIARSVVLRASGMNQKRNAH